MESQTGTFLILALCCAAGMIIAGCSQPAAPAQTPAATTAAPATGQPGTGIANPASVNCENLGGAVEIKTDPAGGQYGMCRFANGTFCEEWALFRGEGCKQS